MIKLFTCVAIIVVASIPVKINAQSLPPYLPSREEVLQHYKAAGLLDSLAKGSVLNATIQANWQPGNTSFWYKHFLTDSNFEYLYVNAVTGVKQKAFDHEKMAAALNKLVTDTPLTALRLPITLMRFSKNNATVLIRIKRKHYYTCNLKTYACQVADSIPTEPDNSLVTGNIKDRWDRQPASDSLSPDRQWLAFITKGNLFIQPARGGAAVQYTNDGDTTNPYGQIQWSPDSKHLVVFHIRPVEDKPVYYILSSVDSLTRGVLKSHPYPQPGDAFTSYEMFTVNLDNKKLVKVNTEMYDFLDYPWIHWRGNDNRYFIYEKADRGH
jgi:hypothetical protein